jgi:hypothetical protein
MREFIDPKLVMMTDDEPLVHQIDELSLHVILEGEMLDMKYRAMLCQQSQIGPLISIVGPERYRDMLAEEAFRDGRVRPWA